MRKERKPRVDPLLAHKQKREASQKRALLNPAPMAEPKRNPWEWRGRPEECPKCAGKGEQHIQIGHMVHHQECVRCRGYGMVSF